MVSGSDLEGENVKSYSRGVHQIGIGASFGDHVQYATIRTLTTATFRMPPCILPRSSNATDAISYCSAFFERSNVWSKPRTTPNPFPHQHKSTVAAADTGRSHPSTGSLLAVVSHVVHDATKRGKSFPSRLPCPQSIMMVTITTQPLSLVVGSLTFSPRRSCERGAVEIIPEKDS